MGRGFSVKRLDFLTLRPPNFRYLRLPRNVWRVASSTVARRPRRVVFIFALALSSSVKRRVSTHEVP